jgi:high-affinity Fe2+/Pb2+ permease
MSALAIVAGAPGKYISWGVIQISVANLAIICVMILLFILALVVPFPTHDEQSDEEGHSR